MMWEGDKCSKLCVEGGGGLLGAGVLLHKFGVFFELVGRLKGGGGGGGACH